MTPNATLTRDRIEEIMGRLDDLRLAEILETRPSEPELMEAKRWMAGYVRTLADDAPMRPSVVTRLCDIMKADEPDWDDDPALH